jgi:nucleoside-diphosphate-sugar epimerase
VRHNLFSGTKRDIEKLEFRPAARRCQKQRRRDITLARKRLEWAPTVSLEEGLMPTAISVPSRAETRGV